MNEKQKALERAREIIRSVWTDELPQDIQSDLERIYDDLKWISEDIQS